MKFKKIYYASENGCPFCQEKDCNIVKYVPPAMEGLQREGLQVECNDCGARGPIRENKEEAISGWELGTCGINGGKRKL